jgi:uncharacterized protein YhbP (UPF0306 family)
MTTDLKSIVTQILEQGYLMSLATSDADGLWVSDVVYVFDEYFNLYWLSMPDTRHSQAIIKNNQIACSITISNNQGEANVGIQVAGTAQKLETNDLELATRHLAKRKREISDAQAILSKGQSWYKLTPKLIDVIYEPLWGFKKQKLEP